MRAPDAGGSDAPLPARRRWNLAEVRAATCTKIAIESANMNPRKLPGRCGALAMRDTFATDGGSTRQHPTNKNPR
jgi:hypothetical protein